MDHDYTNRVETDYSSIAYWLHAAFPALLPLIERTLTPTTGNAAGTI